MQFRQISGQDGSGTNRSDYIDITFQNKHSAAVTKGNTLLLCMTSPDGMKTYILDSADSVLVFGVVNDDSVAVNGFGTARVYGYCPYHKISGVVVAGNALVSSDYGSGGYAKEGDAGTNRFAIALGADGGGATSVIESFIKAMGM